MNKWKRKISKYLYGTEAVAAIEAALLFPVMMLLLLGMLDVGYGILASQKTIKASQVVADLIARSPSVSTMDITDAVEAGRLALEPFSTGTFGVDIVSILLDEDGSLTVCWRHTVNMNPNETVLTSTDGLGSPGEGVLAVSVKYDYEPGFASNVIGTIEMLEVAYTRGRRAAIIQRDGTCPDAPKSWKG
jgi:Flp pilus assembly protein TadG